MTARFPLADEPTRALVDEFAAALDAADVAFGHGADNPRDEAFRLVAGVLRGRALTASLRHELRGLLERRIVHHVPVAHLVGEAWYHGLRLRVPPGVMIPRSPIAAALTDGLRPWLATPPRRVLDLCCGCGAIGIAAARIFADAAVDLADDDPAALAAARDNAARAGADIAGRLEVIDSDLFDALGGRRYDLILCNPPYVPSAELDAAPPEFRREPRHGLDGGADGLAAWRRVVAGMDAHLADAGVLVGEVGNWGGAFDAAFPELGAVWLDIEHAEEQADGGFGVFVAAPWLRRPSAAAASPARRMC